MQQMLDMVQEVSKIARKSLTNDITKLCHDTAAENLRQNSIGTAWERGLDPELFNRKSALKNDPGINNGLELCLENPPQDDEQIDTVVSILKLKTPCPGASTQSETIQHYQAQPSNVNVESYKTTPILFASCAQVGSLSQGCRSGLKKAIDLAAPKGGDLNLSFMNVYADVLTNSKYDEGLRRASLKVLDKVKTGKVKSSDNMFGDIKSSFIESGVSAKEAEDMTWQTMALISTGSGNIGSRLFNLNTEVKIPTSKNLRCLFLRGPHQFWIALALIKAICTAIRPQ